MIWLIWGVMLMSNINASQNKHIFGAIQGLNAAWKGCVSFFNNKGNIFKAMEEVHDEFEKAINGDAEQHFNDQFENND